MSKDSSLQDEIMDVCLRRGIVFPTAEIYSGRAPAGFYEFGPVGTRIRDNILELWKETFINSEDNVHEISGSLILPEPVFEASGHIDSFNDPLTQCDKCKSMFRADHVIEDAVQISSEGKSNEEMFELIKKHEIKCPNCKGELSLPREFNMMFETEIGPTGGVKGYLRPETAQNIFLNFRRISHSMRSKLPFGVAQIGKAFRNEISPRNFLIRMREFEQMEVEMFVDPDEINNHPKWDEVQDFSIRFLSREAQENNEDPVTVTLQEALDKGMIINQYIGYYMAVETMFLTNLGIDFEKCYFRHLMDHETAHYSAGNYDLEIEFPFGIVECIGLAYRTDYDLKKHMENSGQKMHINVPGKGNIIPHVIEPSAGLTRLFYATLLANYVFKDSAPEGMTPRDWTWFKFPGAISPWEVSVLPLMKKDGLAEGAKTLYWDMKDYGLDVTYDESGKIGKRYARSDESGVSYAVTYDYDSKEKDVVTIRDRNTTRQASVPIEDVPQIIRELILDLFSWEDLEEEYPLETSDSD